MPVQGQGISVAQLLANNARGKKIAAVYDASAVRPYTDLLTQGAKDIDDYFAGLREQQALDEDAINKVIEDAPVRYKELAEENTLHLRDMVADSVRKGKTNDPAYRKEFGRELSKIQKYSYAAQNASGVLAEAKKVIDSDPYVDKAKAYALIDKYGQGDIKNLNLADVLEKVGADPTIRDYDQYLTDKLKNLPKTQGNITTEDSRYITDQVVTYPSKFARIDPETNRVVFDIPDQSADALWNSYDMWAKKDVAQRAKEKRNLVRDLLQKEKDGAITDEEQGVLDGMDISVYESGSTQDQIRDVLKSDVESSLDVKYGNLKRTAKRQPTKGPSSKPTVAEKKEKVLKDFVTEYPKLVASNPEAYKDDLERRLSSMGLEKEMGKDFKVKDIGNNKWEINYMARNPLYEMSDSQGWFQAPPIVVEDISDPAALEDVLRSVLLPYSTEGLKHKKKVEKKMKEEPKPESGKKEKIKLNFNKPKTGIVESIKEGLKNIFTSDKDGQTE